MKRDVMLRALRQKDRIWDMIVVGGGATGMGIAVDAASRGYQVLLFERDDFGTGTSSRSTKLAHGGVRYLQQGNISLVLEALRERGRMIDNAPHLVSNLPFVVPNYDWWEAPFYGIGLKLYDVLAGRHNLGGSKLLDKEGTLERIPTIETKGLKGGVVYHDGQFDDARLVINLAQTAVEQGATVINRVEVTGLIKEDGFTRGVTAVERESGQEIKLAARVVINATGPFTDGLRRLDDPEARPLLRPSQGTHIVLPERFLGGENAIMVPHTDDGRVLFAIPWLGRALVGTTDIEVETIEREPLPREDEIDFLVTHAARYMTEDPTRDDVLSVFSGLRPLVGGGDGEDGTSSISRDHSLTISSSGLVTIAGGKWTTYRKMAEDTVDQAAVLAQLEDRPCVTADLAIHGHHRNAARFGKLERFGSDAPAIEELVASDPALGEPLAEGLPYVVAEVVWAARHEMARTVEDVLARRTRALLLDAAGSINAAPVVAKLLAKELGLGKSWVKAQTAAYGELARHYLP